MVMMDGHHETEFPQMWCAAGYGVQGELIAEEPRRYFRPPYVGHRGWVGVRLDRGAGADEIAELCVDAYRVVAPKTLVARLDQDG
jgi:hypothetical protein